MWKVILNEAAISIKPSTFLSTLNKPKTELQIYSKETLLGSTLFLVDCECSSLRCILQASCFRFLLNLHSCHEKTFQVQTQIKQKQRKIPLPDTFDFYLAKYSTERVFYTTVPVKSIVFSLMQTFHILRFLEYLIL